MAKKTKALKRKTTGFDILYRVVTAIGVIAMYPLFYFASLFTFEIEHNSISNFLNLFKGDTEKTLEITYDSISLSELGDWVNTIKSVLGNQGEVQIDIWGNPLYRPIIVAAILIGIVLVIGLVILGFAIFSNKVKVITGLSAAGLVLSFAAYGSFTWYFANPLLRGENALANLFNVTGEFSSFIVGLLGQLTVLRLDTGFFAVLFIMLGILIWSLSVMLVNASDEKEKAMKKAAKNNK